MNEISKDTGPGTGNINTKSNVTTPTTTPTTMPKPSEQEIPCIISAGILPYSYAPSSNNIYFLLGRESYNPTWASSDRWCEFGGCLHHGEQDIDCAAREFMEESLGLVDIDGPIKKTANQNSPLGSPTPSPNNTPIQQQPSSPKRPHLTSFENVRDCLSRKQYTYRISVNSTHFVKPSHSTHRQSSTSTSTEAKRGNHVDVSSSSSSSSSSSRTSDDIPKTRICFVKKIPWQPHLPELFQHVNAKLLKLRELSLANDNSALEDYYHSLPLWLQSHPAIRMKKNDQDKIIQISVRPEWLEKQQLSWFSLPRLRQILKNGGRFKKTTFRFGFLPTLAIIVEKFSKLETQMAMREDFIIEIEPIVHQQIVGNAIEHQPQLLSPDLRINHNYFMGKLKD